MSAQPLSPSVLLATSMHAQPGVYALMLGSGVSTGAGVLTGWGIVRELVRRVAAATGGADSEAVVAAAEADPEKWWAEHGTGELGYSTLLEALAPTAAARQGLLAEFFEPTEDERAEGIKVPSAAHHSIAQLVKRGLVRVILTTNFDRLTEQALEAAGVSPQVIARPEAVNGMAPLAHATATVIKLHGDYKDLGSRNTPEELSEYPDEWKILLRQVFDEYGLIVSGWSAEWDAALVSALDAATNRRYPLYWDSRSSKRDAAQQLLRNRRGIVIDCDGADELFAGLASSVEALDRLAQPQLTTAMAVARLKRYLPDPIRRIDLHDLVMDSAEQVAAHVSKQTVSVPSLDGPFIERLWNEHLEAVDPFVQLLITGIWHDPEGTQIRLWEDALQRLIDAGTARLSSATTGLDGARLWPALIAMTAAGVAATRRDQDADIIALATHTTGRDEMGTSRPLPAVQLLHTARILDDNWVNAMPRWEGQKWLFPASHLLKTDVRRFFETTITDETDYETAFHGYEYRRGLLQEHTNDTPMAYRADNGEYVGRWRWEDDTPYAEIEFRQAEGRSTYWPWPGALETSDLDDTLIKHRDVLQHYKR